MALTLRVVTDGSPLPGRRERKKLATRHALSSAALQLAVERGLENVTIEDITDRADVSLRTFRNYFAASTRRFARSRRTGPGTSVRRCLSGRPASRCGMPSSTRCCSTTRRPGRRLTRS